jgi:hypothetical protein
LSSVAGLYCTWQGVGSAIVSSLALRVFWRVVLCTGGLCAFIRNVTSYSWLTQNGPFFKGVGSQSVVRVVLLGCSVRLGPSQVCRLCAVCAALLQKLGGVLESVHEGDILDFHL